MLHMRERPKASKQDIERFLVRKLRNENYIKERAKYIKSSYKSLENSLVEMKKVRDGELKGKTWREFKEELDSSNT